MAFLCFPVFALAEDSPNIEYRDSPPTVTGKQSDGSSSSSSRGDGGADVPGKSSTAPGTSDAEPADDQSSGDKSGAVVGGKSGGGGGKDASGSGSQDRQRIGAGTPLTTEDAAIAHESSSSPLVPILIALAILAAMSVGAVAMKRRRQGSGDGSAVTPEAG